MKRALSHPHFGLAPWIIFLPPQTSWQDTTRTSLPNSHHPISICYCTPAPSLPVPTLSQPSVSWGTAKWGRVSALPKRARSHKRWVEQKEEEEEGNSTLGNRGSYSGCPLHLQELTAFAKKPKEKVTEPQGRHCPTAASWQPSGALDTQIYHFS